MTRTSWTDLYCDGRRLEGIIKQMNTKFYSTEDDSLRLAYVDRIIKATNTKIVIVDMVLGVQEFLKEVDKIDDTNPFSSI